MSDSDDMDAQTSSSHPESGDAAVCNDEASAVESAEGGNYNSFFTSSKFYYLITSNYVTMGKHIIFYYILVNFSLIFI